jgi:hypothetical protein
MVLTTRNYPPTMKALSPRVRRKAVELGNQLLAEGYPMQQAMIIATSIAKEWAEHRQTVRERNIHVVPHQRGWMVRRACGPGMSFDEKTRALSYAVELARAEGVYVIAHDESGAIDAQIHITCRS